MSKLTVFAHLMVAAAEDAVGVTKLVTAAKIVASAAGDVEFAQWCANELAGYPRNSDVPEYRTVACQLYADSAYQTGVPVILRGEGPGPYNQLNAGMALSDLEEMAKAKPGAAFQVEFSPQFHQKVLATIKDGGDVHKVYRVIQAAGIKAAVALIRRRVSEWAIERVSHDVVLPGGLSMQALVPLKAEPSPAPEAIVADSHGLKFDVSGSGNSFILQTGSNNNASASAAATINDARQLATLLEAGLVSGKVGEEGDELREAVAQLKALVGMPKPQTSWIGECARSIRTILENGAGSLIANLATPQVTALISGLAG